MKTYKIYSPAYEANGLNGTYYSIAVCEDNGDFIKIVGDHAKGTISNKFFHEQYTNIHEIIGMPFSDSDRFIQIEEVKVDLEKIDEWEKSMIEKEKELAEYESKRMQFVNGDLYSFLHGSKNQKVNIENREKYSQWISENPFLPKHAVNYYGFLKSIEHEN